MCIAKSIPNPIYNTANAIDIRFKVPTVIEAKAVVIINPTISVVRQATTIRKEPRPMVKIVATRIIDRKIAFIFALDTLFSSS